MAGTLFTRIWADELVPNDGALNSAQNEHVACDELCGTLTQSLRDATRRLQAGRGGVYEHYVRLYVQ